MSYSYDEEAGLLGDSKQAYSYEFAEKTVRQGFIRKVLGILSVQLLATAGITALFCLHAGVKAYVTANMWPFWTAFALSMVVVIALGVSETLRRSHPINLITLAAFTLCESVLVGTISTMFPPGVVLMAVGITAAVVVGCMLFSLQTKLDLTMTAGALVSVSFALFSAILLNIFIQAQWLYVGICAVGVVLFSVYLIFDIQLLMGGHKYALSPDEFVFAALNLYLDIINVFLYILQLLGNNRS